MTKPEWLPVTAQITNLVNDWANRKNLVAFIGEGATEGLAPALFKPQTAEIEVDVKLAFGFGVEPHHIGDLTKISTRYEFPRATGAILHEAFHARFSHWNIAKANEDLKQDEFQALMLLEEGRIEAFGLSLDPKYRLFLRASALELALAEMNAETLTQITTFTASQLVGLVQARVIAGVLLQKEVAEVLEIAEKFLGTDVYNRLTEICSEYQAHSNHWSIESKYHLAIEWAEIIRNLQTERGEQPQDFPVSIPVPVSEGGEGTEISKELSDLLDKLSEAKDDVELSNTLALGDQQRDEEWEEEVKNRNEKAKEIEESSEVASEVFSKSTGEAGETSSRSKLVETRNANSNERTSAVIVSRMLEKAKYRDRDVTVVKSNLPQGRLNTRLAMQNEAQKALGLLPNAEAWRRKARKQTDEPTLSVGVMVDISGSMGTAMQPMASTAWIMSEAVRRVQGKTAMVYYGADVFPTLKAGQHLEKVSVYSATDPTEKFGKAFKALDGSLNLLYGNGVRLLVVVSDGIYTDKETRTAKALLKKCSDNGVGVVWINFSYNREPSELLNGTNGVLLQGMSSDVARAIGKACAEALEQATLKV